MGNKSGNTGNQTKLLFCLNKWENYLLIQVLSVPCVPIENKNVV